MTLLLDNPDPLNVHWAEATNRTLCDAIRKAPIYEMNVVKENAALVVNVTNHSAAPA
jgi:hypothetical protein